MFNCVQLAIRHAFEPIEDAIIAEETISQNDINSMRIIDFIRRLNIEVKEINLS